MQQLMLAEDGVTRFMHASSTHGHTFHATSTQLPLIFHPLSPHRVQHAARHMQQLMLAEDGVANTVEHMHRTIYGSLLFGEQHR